MALSGFGLLLLGFAHLLNPFGFAGLLILDAAFFWLLKRDNLLSFIFWRRDSSGFRQVRIGSLHTPIWRIFGGCTEQLRSNPNRG